jgi:hypothetical protein
MRSGRPWAAASAAIALLMNGVYLWLVHQDGNPPAIWFAAGLAVAGLLAGYGALRTGPGRRPALIASGVLQLGLGLVGILTIGLPIILGGLLAVVAAGRLGDARGRVAAMAAGRVGDAPVTRPETGAAGQERS